MSFKEKMSESSAKNRIKGAIHFGIQKEGIGADTAKQAALEAIHEVAGAESFCDFTGCQQFTMEYNGNGAESYTANGSYCEKHDKEQARV